jgi:hypothetical protein
MQETLKPSEVSLLITLLLVTMPFGKTRSSRTGTSQGMLQWGQERMPEVPNTRLAGTKGPAAFSEVRASVN